MKLRQLAEDGVWDGVCPFCACSALGKGRKLSSYDTEWGLDQALRSHAYNCAKAAPGLDADRTSEWKPSTPPKKKAQAVAHVEPCLAPDKRASQDVPMPRGVWIDTSGVVHGASDYDVIDLTMIVDACMASIRERTDAASSGVGEGSDKKRKR